MKLKFSHKLEDARGLGLKSTTSLLIRSRQLSVFFQFCQSMIWYIYHYFVHALQTRHTAGSHLQSNQSSKRQQRLLVVVRNWILMIWWSSSQHYARRNTNSARNTKRNYYNIYKPIKDQDMRWTAMHKRRWADRTCCEATSLFSNLCCCSLPLTTPNNKRRVTTHFFDLTLRCIYPAFKTESIYFSTEISPALVTDERERRIGVRWIQARYRPGHWPEWVWTCEVPLRPAFAELSGQNTERRYPGHVTVAEAWVWRQCWGWCRPIAGRLFPCTCTRWSERWQPLGISRRSFQLKPTSLWIAIAQCGFLYIKCFL